MPSLLVNSHCAIIWGGRHFFPPLSSPARSLNPPPYSYYPNPQTPLSAHHKLCSSQTHPPQANPYFQQSGTPATQSSAAINRKKAAEKVAQENLAFLKRLQNIKVREGCTHSLCVLVVFR